MITIGAKFLRVFVLFCVLLGNTPLAFAQGQTTGAIQGRAYDVGTNLPLVGVTITATNRDNGLERTTVTGADGTYTITILPPAIYSIRATINGYETEPLPDFAVRLGKTNIVQPPPFAMRKVGAPSQQADPVQPATPVQPAPKQPVSPGSESKSEQLTNTVNPTRGENFDRLQLLSLPLPGFRTFDSLAFLVSGVAPPPQAIGQSVGPGIGAGIGTVGQFSVNGNRSRANNFTIDGSDNNDQDVGVRRQGFLAPTPQSIDSLQEFRISTLLWDAEFGRNPGSQVNAVTRNGGNAPHGALYAFMSNDLFNARNAFDFTGGASQGQDGFHRLQAGVAIGGAVVPNKTFLFGSFEFLYLNATSEQHFASPTAADRRFLGRPFLGAFTNFTVGGIPFDYVTAAGATPAGLSLLSLYPLPNNYGPYGVNTLTQVLPAGGDGPIGSLKLTHQVSPTNTLNARYNISDDDRALPSIKRAINSSIESSARTQNVSLTLDSSVSPTLANQGRFSFGRTRLNFTGNQGTFNGTSSSVISAFNKAGVLLGTLTGGPNTGPIGELIIRPFSPVGLDAFLFPQDRANNTFQFADSMSKTILNHSLKFGGDIRHVQLNSRQDRNYRPRFEVNNGRLDITNLDTGDNEARFLPGVGFASLGQVSSIQQTLTAGPPDSNIRLRFTEYNLFVNDNWRIRPNFTLDYGVRYEFNSVPREADDRIERALQLEDLPSPGSSSFDTPERTAFFNGLIGAYKTIVDGRTRIYEPDRNNFGPHMGFAWDPWSDGKTSIRAGYGVYFDAVLGAVVSQSRNVFPTEIPINIDGVFIPQGGLGITNPAFLGITNSQGTFIPLILDKTQNQFGFSGADFPALLAQLFLQSPGTFGLAFTLPEKNLRTPYVQQWHLSIERQLFNDFLISAAYVGTKGTKLTRLTTPNGGPSVTSFNFLLEAKGFASTVDFTNSILNQFPINRGNDFLGAFQIFENSARSTYHSLQLEARKRYSHGFTFTTAYTWSHAMDDVSDIADIAGAPVLAQDSSNLRAERASAGFDARQRFTASFIWDLPFHRGSTEGAGRWLGGWQLSSIFQAHTGQPFTLNIPLDSNLDGNLTDRPANLEGLSFFEGHGSRKVALSPGKDILDFLSDGSGNGAVGRNTVRGDSFINLDIAFGKKFQFAESRQLEFRAEVFNSLNRANFGIPVRVIGDPGFGSSIDTVNPARTIQFALKYSF